MSFFNCVSPSRSAFSPTDRQASAPPEASRARARFNGAIALRKASSRCDRREASRGYSFELNPVTGFAHPSRLCLRFSPRRLSFVRKSARMTFFASAGAGATHSRDRSCFPAPPVRFLLPGGSIAANFPWQVDLLLRGDPDWQIPGHSRLDRGVLGQDDLPAIAGAIILNGVVTLLATVRPLL